MFRSAHSGASQDWRHLTADCLEQLGPAAARGAQVGFVYASDHLADSFEDIVARLRQATGIRSWVGALGMGVMGDGRSYFDEPALAVMTAPLATEAMRLIAPFSGGELPPGLIDWTRARPDSVAIVHGDGRAAGLAEGLGDLADLAGCFAIGGLGSSRVPPRQAAGAVAAAPLSGIALAPDCIAAIGLTQGCSPVGSSRHRITKAEGGLIETLDDQPALHALQAALLELPPDERERAARRLHVALPIAGRSESDYLVRNLVGVDPANGTIAIGDDAEPGRELIFVRRDREAAAIDLRRMAARTRKAAPDARAALYFSCVARGPNMFPGQHGELRLLRAAIGELPLVGLFCDGEIFDARLYGYTGVLALLA